jgi:penicillin amidase
MVTHLMAPGFNVTGAGPVWRPGVQFGHNEHIAFGRTDFQIDQEDLYVLELDAQGTSYRGPQGPVALEERDEVIEVRGAAPVKVKLQWAAMGPVFHRDEATRTALAVRAVWLEPATCVALEYVPKLFAHDWPTFRKALRAAVWGTNYMYADAKGHIGWQAAGRVPVRAQHDGLMPVPAALGYEWTGILPLDDMPHEFDPPRGWIGTANQCPAAPNWPGNGKVISFEWKPDDRYRRVEQLLQQQVAQGATVEMSWRDQQDVLSLRAVELMSLMKQALGGPGASLQGSLKAADLSAEGRQLAQTLWDWDGKLEARSGAATAYAAFWSVLQREARQALVPEGAKKLITTLHPHAVTAWWREITASAQGPAQWVRILHETVAHLARVVVSTSASAGPSTLPAWGALHTVDLRHALSTWMPSALKDRLHAVGGPSGGDAGTVQARWYASFDRPKVTGGASFRAALEAGAWHTAQAINFPGQSGDPRSPHYRDLYDRWVAGQGFKLPFSAQEVEQLRTQEAHTLILKAQDMR